MDQDSISMIMNAGIMAIIYGSLPCVGVGLVVGLLISIVQAVTQIQEQTLTFVPKMVAVFLILAMTFPWLTNLMTELCFNLWKNIPYYAK